MEIKKYYSLDECTNKDLVHDELSRLQLDSKLYFDIIEQDVVKIIDTGLSNKDKKDLLNFFYEQDVIDHDDYHNYDDDSEEEEEDFNEEDDF